MDQNATQPLDETRLVVYRCPCGNRLTLNATTGGECSECQRKISAKSLANNLASTVSLEDENFEIDQNDTSPRSLVSSTEIMPVILDDEPDEDPTTLIGKRFGHFEIISPVGRGGMGQVYRALDTSLQRYVAVKVLRSGIANADGKPSSSDGEIDKLLQEAISQARVSHPNIVTIYYVGKEEGNPFLAMELVNGQTLNQRIAAGDLSFQETVRIGLELASALRASLELDIIHGDIKPSNILITPEGSPKLSDFGMARIASENATVAAGGTPNYLAPEILTGYSTSPQSDIYALGVTLYEMTFGKLPFTMFGQDIAKWVKTHEGTELMFPSPWPPQIPESWKTVLTRMLAKRPEDRYTSYDALIDDLTRLQAHSMVAARFVPRLIAAGIDWAAVLLITIGFQSLLVLALQQSAAIASSSWLNYFFGSLTFLPIIAYWIAIYMWRQSIGRRLMHLRVVNQYGFRPTRREMALRSLLRMQFPWFVIFQILFSGPAPQTLVASISYLISGLFLLLDIGVMLVAANGTSIHDMIVRTRVVLDTHKD